jgi:dTDP-4-dehydrorhamnose 3,5-epimerase-like enzyme
METTQNQRYTDQVRLENYTLPSNVPLDDIFRDERGEIQNLILNPITSVARISSKRGSIRANHYHKTDWHYAFIESGSILYFERKVGEQSIPKPVLFSKGQMFFTGPNVEHAMLFTEDTVFYTFARNVRSHLSHESDLVRVNMITAEIATHFLHEE